MTSSLPLYSLFLVLGSILGVNGLDTTNWRLNENRSVVVLAATTKTNAYYGEFYEDIKNFQIHYAKQVLKHENVLIFADSAVASEYRQHLPAEVVVEYSMPDIWLRDFTSIRLNLQKKFKYQPNYLKKEDASFIQNAFKKFIDANEQTFGSIVSPGDSKIVLDGGNVVDNFIDKAIITERIFKDNPTLTKSKVIAQVKEDLRYSKVAIIPDLGDRTGHSDGMVSFIDENVLAITNSLGENKPRVERAINDSFAIEIVGLDSIWGAEVWRKFESSCGLHINALATLKFLYVPVFGKDPDNAQYKQSEGLDAKVLKQIQDKTTKTVVPINVPNKICRMGGSVRCLSWSFTKNSYYIAKEKKNPNSKATRGSHFVLRLTTLWSFFYFLFFVSEAV